MPMLHISGNAAFSPQPLPVATRPTVLQEDNSIINAEAAALIPKIILDPAAHIFHPASLPELNTPEPTAPQLPAHPSIQTPQ